MATTSPIPNLKFGSHPFCEAALQAIKTKKPISAGTDLVGRKRDLFLSMAAILLLEKHGLGAGKNLHGDAGVQPRSLERCEPLRRYGSQSQNPIGLFVAITARRK